MRGPLQGPRVVSMAHRSTALACICGLLLLPAYDPPISAGSHTAQKRAQRLSPHLGDLESAKKLALERNAPLLIHIILEGEDQNDEYRDGILPNTELTRVSEGCVVVIGNNGEHQQTKITEKIDGEKVQRRVCSVYQMFENCGQHRECWGPIYNAYQDPNGELGCPQTVLLDPAGKISWRHNVRNPPSASEVTKAVKAAKKVAGKSLSMDGLRSVKGHFIAAGNAAKAEDWPTVWLRNQAILDLIDVGYWSAGAESAQENALKEMAAHLATLEERFVPGQVAEVWRELTLFAKATRETPIASKLTRLRKRVEGNKELKQELTAIKAELAAEELEAEAEALLADDRESRAIKLFKKILGKKYAETETARRVRERFPDL